MLSILFVAASLSFSATATGVEKGTPIEFLFAGKDTDRDYETELDAATTSIDRLVRDLSDNLFVSEEDKKSVAQYVSIVRKEIAWARVDMRKLRYGDE